MNRYLKSAGILFALLYIFLPVNAGDIRIGLFYGSQVQSMVFSVVEGEYQLTGDGKIIGIYRKGSIFHIEREGTAILVNDIDRTYGSFMKISFQGTSGKDIFQIKPVFQPLKGKESEDDLDLSVHHNAIRIINVLDLEKYIPGTVETEGGSTALPEYYKAQSVITRTYAVRNFHRHAPEGFNLCDAVHCQAYNGKSRMNKEIYQAALLTHDQILADKNGALLITAYHSNCGGETGNASMIWNRELPYLVPIHDPFCNKASNYTWTKTISVTAWKAYLIQKGVNGDKEIPAFKEVVRRKYFFPENNSILMTDFRQDFNLKSAFFLMEQKGESLVINGHGYGHGLGLCQQGAMEMAKMGFCYVDILMFYFRGAELKIQQKGKSTIDGTSEPKSIID